MPSILAVDDSVSMRQLVAFTLKEAGFDRPPATLDEFVAQSKGTTKPGQWGSLWSWKHDPEMQFFSLPH